MDNYQKFFDNLYELENKGSHSVSSFVWNDLKIPPDVTGILDAGCWRGDFLNSLPDTYDKTGVDISASALRNVKAKTVVGSIEKMPFPDKTFDLVTSFEVLEHLPYNIFPAAVSELERVSKKYIAVSVPNNQLLKQAFVKCSYCGCLFNPDYHVRSFDKTKLKNLFKEFIQVSCIECGPLIDDYPAVVNFLVPLMGLKPKPSTICPQCGYTEKHNQTIASAASQPEHPQPKNLVSTLKSFLKRNKRPYWLLAFYKRNENL
jgi:hypothetical protein